MKTTLYKILLALVFFVAAVTQSSAETSTANKAGPARCADSIFIHKQTISKTHKISLYPDANQKVVFFSVKGEEGRSYQLFVFDLEGKLVTRTEIRNKQTTVIRDMEKGTYVFDVFSDDMKIGNGQMTVR